ncbi:hypothetical protein ABFS83_07G089800 [Erythranthe nasuta]
MALQLVQHLLFSILLLSLLLLSPIISHAKSETMPISGKIKHDHVFRFRFHQSIRRF